jgi:ParB family chromosome partitioning protein
VKPLVKSSLPPAYKKIEDNLASHFATKVKLDRSKNGKGSVTIEFYSDEELDSILEKIDLYGG